MKVRTQMRWLEVEVTSTTNAQRPTNFELLVLQPVGITAKVRSSANGAS